MESTSYESFKVTVTSRFRRCPRGGGDGSASFSLPSEEEDSLLYSTAALGGVDLLDERRGNFSRGVWSSPLSESTADEVSL